MTEETAEEGWIRLQLALLEKAYRRDAQPLIDRLVAIRDTKPLPLWVQADKLQAKD